jgi:hypothetical protein
MDHDDTLWEGALAEVVIKLRRDPEIDLFYSDEDKLGLDGSERHTPFFKPRWSPELFTAVNYLAHFVVVKRSLVERVSGLRSQFDGAQDYDFLLRLQAYGPKLCHIHRMSYHWRVTPGSTALRPDQKNYADSAGVRALIEHADRLAIEAEAVPVEGKPTNYRLKYRSKRAPVHIIKDGVELASSADSEWARELSSVALQPGIGMVGAQVVWRGGRFELGYALQDGRLAPIYDNISTGWSLTGDPNWPSNWLVPPLTAWAISDSTLKRVGGRLDDPIDLAIRCHLAGQRNVFWPFASFKLDRQYRPQSRAVEVNKQLAVDPYLNPNLVVKDGRRILRLR